MRIAIISDWHLGWGFDGELGRDSFDNLKTAFLQIEKQNIDLVLVPGDLFDMPCPSQDILLKAITLLNEVGLENKLGLMDNSGKTLKLPMLGITGNHEYRGKDYASTLEVLEATGFVKNLKNSCERLEKENIAIFAMPAIPEKFALSYLKEKFNPRPLPNYLNILVLHQSLKEYLPFEDEMVASISLSDLPQGFDIIINGHLHWSSVVTLPSGVVLVLPGSTVTTQVKKRETEIEKGYFILDTSLPKDKMLEFNKIEGARKAYYISITSKKDDIKKIQENIEKELSCLEKDKERKALVRIRLQGELAEGEFTKNLNLNKIKEEYLQYFYISIKNEIAEKNLKDSIEQLRKLQAEAKSAKELGKEIFLEQMRQIKVSQDFDYLRLYELLENGDVKKAKELL